VIAPRWPLLAVALLAAHVARRRTDARPVAVALATLAAIDFARVYTLAHFAEWYWGRVHGALGMAWPGVSAALSWRVWRGLVVGAPAVTHDVAVNGTPASAATEREVTRSTTGDVAIVRTRLGRFVLGLGKQDARLVGHRTARGYMVRILARLRGWPVVALAFAVYAAALTTLPPRNFWPAHPRAWAVAQWLPYAAPPVVSLVAWWTQAEGARKGSVGRTVAFLLAMSALTDVAVGALAPGATWARAAPLAWATWVAVGVVLVRARRGG
jgi:hypothetical protein